MSDKQTSESKEQPLPGTGTDGAPAPSPASDGGGGQGATQPVDQSAQEQIAEERIAPVVLLTAFSQRELVERAREAGAMAYVVKPFTVDDVVPAIEIAMSRFEEISALENEVADMKEQFATRKLVERAKSLLQTKMGLSEPEAFRWIQKTSMDRRLSMREVAEAIINQVA